MTRIAPWTRAQARALRLDMTPQERRLWQYLREINRQIGTRFRRQAPVGPYIADFCDFGRRLVIEADGSGHGGPKDTVRDAWFALQGFRLLRFWNREIEDNPEGVMQVILEAIEAAPPPPPSPTRGEGATRHGTGAPRWEPGASPPPRGEGMGEGGGPHHPGGQTGLQP